MPKLVIDDNYAEVFFNDNYVQHFYSDLIFGDIISILEKEYPKMVVSDKKARKEYAIKYLMEDLSGKNDFKLWGLGEGSSALSNMYDFLLNDVSIRLSFKMVEELRLKYQFTSYQRYEDYGHTIFNKNAIVFDGLKTITQVLCSVLYYYALNDYKIKKCLHCGKWFATQDGSCKYCRRKSPIDKYSHLRCVEAQQRIRKNKGCSDDLTKRRNTLISTLDRLINQKGLPPEELKKFREESKEVKKTKTEIEYSQWLYEQELKYKPRTKKEGDNINVKKTC